jgi:hypothetical protein
MPNEQDRLQIFRGGAVLLHGMLFLGTKVLRNSVYLQNLGELPVGLLAGIFVSAPGGPAFIE